jgi:hypothetical protein
MSIVQRHLIPDKHCEYCGKAMRAADHNASSFSRRRYCSLRCMNKGSGEREKRSSYRANMKRPYVELAGGKCQRCGYDEFLSGLDFHHVDPKKKDFKPGDIIATNDYVRIYAELDKCCLLCSNCHKAFHGNDWQTEFIKRDGMGWTIDTLSYKQRQG